MPIQSFVQGPGTFTLGEAPDELDASCQMTNLRVVCTENIKTTDAIPVLCGEELPAEDDVSYSWKLQGTGLQDLEETGFVAYTWLHKGEVLPFTFVPSTAAGRQVTGMVRVVPLQLGGDVKKRNTSDLDWVIPDGNDPAFEEVPEP